MVKKWEKYKKIICDHKVPIKLKSKFYNYTILYSIKCQTLKEQHERKVKVVKMRMLRWIRDYTRKDKI